MEEMVSIVDKDNNVIGIERRSIMRKNKLPHRASYIVLENSKGQYYVEVRTVIKDYCPGMLDACIGGVVQADENDIDQSAHRELKEEMGIETTLKSLGWFMIGHSEDDFVYAALYHGVYDGPFTMQESEVSDVLMLDYNQIIQRKAEFTPDSLIAIAEVRRLLQ